MDHRQFGRNCVAFLTKLDQVDVVITDAQTPANILAEVSSKGVEVIRADQPATPPASS